MGSERDGGRQLYPKFFFLEADFRCIIYIYIYIERERERERREEMSDEGERERC